LKIKAPKYSFENTSPGEYLADVLLWDIKPVYDFENEHSHSFNEIMIVTKGGGDHLIDNEVQIVTDFQFHILPSNCIHILNRVPESRGFTIAFSDLFIEQLMSFERNSSLINLIFNPQVIQANEVDFKDLGYYFEQIINYKERDDIFYNMMSLLLLKINKICINIKANNNEVNSYSKIGYAFLKVLNTNFKEKKKIEFYADQLGITKSKLNLELKKYFGDSFKGLLNDKLINEAKQLLKSNKFSTSEVCYTLGFYDDAHFCHFFKKNIGLTPKQFLEKK
jgi:AraC family transcriptional activator of pobA